MTTPWRSVQEAEGQRDRGVASVAMPFIRGSRIQTQKTGLGACHPTVRGEMAQNETREPFRRMSARARRFDQSRGRKRLRTVFHVGGGERSATTSERLVALRVFTNHSSDTFGLILDDGQSGT